MMSDVGATERDYRGKGATVTIPGASRAVLAAAGALGAPAHAVPAHAVPVLIAPVLIAPVLIAPVLVVAVLIAPVLIVTALIVVVAGCSSAPAPGATGTTCGHTRTAVGVPVVIMVARGTVDCATALRVEAGYAATIESGDLHGNGGGAPVAVDGWTCESYPTPDVLRTGDASECHTASAEVVAVLSLSSVSAVN